MITLKRYYKYDLRNAEYTDEAAVGGGWVCEFEIRAHTNDEAERDFNLIYNDPSFEVSPKSMGVGLNLGIPAVGSIIEYWDKNFDGDTVCREYVRTAVPQGFYEEPDLESEWRTHKKEENYRDLLLEENPDMTEEDIRKALDERFKDRYGWLLVDELAVYSQELATYALPVGDIVKSDQIDLDAFYDLKTIVMSKNGYAGYSTMEKIPYFGSPEQFWVRELDCKINLTKYSSSEDICNEIKSMAKEGGLTDENIEKIAEEYKGLNKYNFASYYGPFYNENAFETIVESTETDDSIKELREKRFKDFTDDDWNTMSKYSRYGFAPGVLPRIEVSDNHELIDKTVTITENGTYVYNPADDYDGDGTPVFGSVTVNASCSPSIGVVVGTKTVVNGDTSYTVKADDFFAVYNNCDELVFKLSDSDYTRPLHGIYINIFGADFYVVSYTSSYSVISTVIIKVEDVEKYFTSDATSEYYLGGRYAFAELVQKKVPYTINSYIT